MNWIWIVVLVILILVFAADVMISYRMFQRIFMRDGEATFTLEGVSEVHKPYVQFGKEGADWLQEKQPQTVSIQSEDGLRLVGHYVPYPQSKQAVLLIHGYHGGAMYDMARFAQYYYERGYTILIPEQRAHNSSEGSYITFGAKEQDDNIRWCNFLLEQLGPDCSLVLHGISMGGSIVCLMHGLDTLPKQVKACIADCGYDNLRDEIIHMMSRQGLMAFDIMLGLVNIWCKRIAKFDMGKVKPIDNVAKGTVPILFIHGDEDRVVPSEMMGHLYEACECQKAKCIVAGAAHAQAYNIHQRRYEEAMDRLLDGTIEHE